MGAPNYKSHYKPLGELIERDTGIRIMLWKIAPHREVLTHRGCSVNQREPVRIGTEAADFPGSDPGKGAYPRQRLQE
jgi:hypothetical protein